MRPAAMNILEYLEHGIKLEEIISRCYKTLAETCPAGEAQNRLLRISGEETNHANVLRSGRDFARKMPDLFGPQAFPSAELLEGVRSAESLLARIVGGGDQKPLLTVLLDLERRFEGIHLNTAVEIQDESLRKLFENLSREDSRHIEALTGIIASL